MSPEIFSAGERNFIFDFENHAPFQQKKISSPGKIFFETFFFPPEGKKNYFCTQKKFFYAFLKESSLNIILVPVFIVVKSRFGLNHFLHQNFIDNAGDCFDISAEKMLDGKNNLPPERDVDEIFLFQDGLLLSVFAKLPKATGEIRGWNFGRKERKERKERKRKKLVCFHKDKIALLKSGKRRANFGDFFFQFHRSGVEMLFQIFEKVKVFLRKSDPQRKRIFLVSKNLEFGFEFHLEPAVIVEAGNQAKRDFP